MIFSIIGKNLKIIFRSPFTLLLLILTPMLLMLLVGYTYSGETLSSATVGFVEAEENFFKLTGVESKFYNTGDYTSSLMNCIGDLNQSNIDICVYFKPTYNGNGELISANTVYYIDNTRPQISDIIIRNFDHIIDSTTKEITTKTVKDIFTEVNDTVQFLKEGKAFTDEIHNDLVLAQNSLKIFDKQLDTTIKEYNILFDELSRNKNSINNKLTSLDRNIKNMQTQINELHDYLEDTNDANNLQHHISNLKNLESKLKTYTSANPETKDYFDHKELSMAIDELEQTNQMLQEAEDLTFQFKQELTRTDDILEINEMFNEIYENIEDGKNYLQTSKEQTSKLIIEINNKEQKLKEINTQLEEKIEYFETLSNQKASQITEPITKKQEPIFYNFKRIHQLTPTVIILIILFIGLLLSNVIVSLEINSKAYFRNLISPIRQRKFISALFFTSLLIILFQVMFLFLVLNFFFNIPINSNIMHILLIIIHSLIIFILIGILLAYTFSSIQISILVTTFVMLFMFLLSDIIVPLEIMPEALGNILRYNPVIIGENLLRLTIFFPETITEYSSYMIFYPYIILLVILIIIASNRRKRKLF